MFLPRNWLPKRTSSIVVLPSVIRPRVRGLGLVVNESLQPECSGGSTDAWVRFGGIARGPEKRRGGAGSAMRARWHGGLSEDLGRSRGAERMGAGGQHSHSKWTMPFRPRFLLALESVLHQPITCHRRRSLTKTMNERENAEVLLMIPGQTGTRTTPTISHLRTLIARFGWMIQASSVQLDGIHVGVEAEL